MSRTTFEQLRLPVGILLLLIVAFIFFPRDGSDPAALEATPSPSASVLVGGIGGEVVSQSAAPATPAPTPPPTAEGTPQPTPAPTPEPEEDGFTAEILACRSIDGPECEDRLGDLPEDASTFVALVRFTDANAGDTLNAVLDGPAGTIPGGAYTLDGGGDGYYYSQFQAANLPPGGYTLTATRNGEEVATTSFSKADD